MAKAQLFYDCIYRDKDYDIEGDFTRDMLVRHAPNARDLLVLGCGTGRHDRLLARHGYEVVGVDNARSMLERALDHLDAPEHRNLAISYVEADMRSLRLERRFDAAVALFHVFSYLVENRDVSACLKSVAEHLKPGGLLLFDCWYGPAVLKLRPETRQGYFEDDQVGVERSVQPTLRVNENRCDTHYDFTVTNKRTGTTRRFSERHSVRYFFVPEIAAFLEAAGFELLATGRCLSEEEPSEDTWGAYFVARHP